MSRGENYESVVKKLTSDMEDALGLSSDISNVSIANLPIEEFVSKFSKTLKKLNKSKRDLLIKKVAISISGLSFLKDYCKYYNKILIDISGVGRYDVLLKVHSATNRRNKRLESNDVAISTLAKYLKTLEVENKLAYTTTYYRIIRMALCLMCLGGPAYSSMLLDFTVVQLVASADSKYNNVTPNELVRAYKTVSKKVQSFKNKIPNGEEDLDVALTELSNARDLKNVIENNPDELKEEIVKPKEEIVKPKEEIKSINEELIDERLKEYNKPIEETKPLQETVAEPIINQNSTAPKTVKPRLNDDLFKPVKEDILEDAIFEDEISSLKEKGESINQIDNGNFSYSKNTRTEFDKEQEELMKEYLESEKQKERDLEKLKAYKARQNELEYNRKKAEEIKRRQEEYIKSKNSEKPKPDLKQEELKRKLKRKQEIEKQLEKIKKKEKEQELIREKEKSEIKKVNFVEDKPISDKEEKQEPKADKPKEQTDEIKKVSFDSPVKEKTTVKETIKEKPKVVKPGKVVRKKKENKKSGISKGSF